MSEIKEANKQFIDGLVKNEAYRKMIEIQEANKYLLDRLQKSQK